MQGSASIKLDYNGNTEVKNKFHKCTIQVQHLHVNVVRYIQLTGQLLRVNYKIIYFKGGGIVVEAL